MVLVEGAAPLPLLAPPCSGTIPQSTWTDRNLQDHKNDAMQ